MSGGPPPVPGGRSPEERAAARRQRDARRSDDGDWLAEAERLTAPPPPPSGRGPRPRWGRIAALVVVVALLAGIGWFLVSLYQPFGDDGGERVSVAVPRGSSLEQIAELLEARGIVSSSTFFQLRARLAGRSDDLKPGTYTLRRDMSYGAALDALEEGVPPNIVRVTIPEGLSRREIAGVLPAGLRGSYVAASRRSPELDPREYRAPAGASLEGFLFPATYELKKGVPVRRLVDRQLAAFEQQFATVNMRYARSKNLTPYDVLTIASMVEREAQVPRERRLIASVIYNRLRDGIRLDIDATTRFAVGNWSRPLKVSEINDPSPYNTRVQPGLPPGPIGNPGLASIEAAANPARTGYIFYVVKPGTCGRHNFAETDAEFQRYVDEYERAREAAGGRSPTNC
ncbi:MAG: endolytic transglycosylase MltG [Thermoleophilaceae bacterium]|nr:endolytic transglycosylase MltG [Thermoleophilaceae bacterium]